MKMIKAAHIFFDYIRRDENDNIEEVNEALSDLNLEIEKGSFVCILGHNGSGKSTFAKLINGLQCPKDGTILVGGMDTQDESKLLKVRETAGMVFQNPDNQIIANVVEEDVGFGPENIGVPTDEIWKRVDASLKAVGMQAYRLKSPNRLSGGQKQRVAIAGVMAMKPECIILDEPTAMLDPNGRKEVLKTAHELNKREGITIVHITHYMEEAVEADRIIVMDKGRAVMDGTPREIFSRVDELKALKLCVPQITELSYELKKAGVNLPEGILTREEFVAHILPMMKEAARKRQ
ncbi:MAG: energy-coupling factor transporter ATPase [Eubacteriales bacterium]|nr:energy-coupling factor transporter ATPase [Eubacteriales bacterium]